MSIPITVGKSRIFSISAPLSNGSQDTTTPAAVSTFAPSSVLKVAVNPTNNREVGVLALAGAAASDVTVTVGTRTASVLVQPVAPTLLSISLGSGDGEVDPPAWLTTP